MLHPYEEVGVWQGQLGALFPQNLPPNFSLCAQGPTRDTQWGTATHKAMGRFWHLGTETTCEKGKRKETAGAALTCVRQQWAFSGGRLSHSPGMEVRKGLMPPPNASTGCLHCPATCRAPNTRDQKVSAFGGLWGLASKKQQVIYICRSGKVGAGLEVFGNRCVTFF